MEDAALLMGVLAGYDPIDPFALDESWNFALPPEPRLSEWRIAYARKFGDFPVEADIVSVIDDAISAFEESGAKVERVDIEFHHSQAELSEIWCRLVSVANLRILEHLKTRGIDLLGWCLTYPVNFSGHPAASIPAGLAAPTLPVGMQIIGRRYADQDVLTASAAFEQRKPWFDTYNICDSRPF